MRFRILPFYSISIFICCTVSPVSAEIVTFVCDYTTVSTSEGHEKVSSSFVLTFIVDSDSDNAYMIGNQGTEDVILIAGDDKVTFIEVTDTNNVMSTTIDSVSDSVHSRHTVLFGKLLAQQYYGSCTSQ